jgi:hypothetical protein
MKTGWSLNFPIVAAIFICVAVQADDVLNSSLAGLYRIDPARESRSISPENFTGEKGKGGMATEGTGKHAASELGRGWKVSPSLSLKRERPLPWRIYTDRAVFRIFG